MKMQACTTFIELLKQTFTYENRSYQEPEAKRTPLDHHHHLEFAIALLWARVPRPVDAPTIPHTVCDPMTSARLFVVFFLVPMFHISQGHFPTGTIRRWNCDRVCAVPPVIAEPHVHLLILIHIHIHIPMPIPIREPCDMCMLRCMLHVPQVRDACTCHQEQLHPVPPPSLPLQHTPPCCAN